MLKRLLLLLVFLLGLVFVFLVPPFQKPDENRHYYQAVALAHGQFSCQQSKEDGVYLTLREDAYNFPAALKTDEIAHTPTYKFFSAQLQWFKTTRQVRLIKETSWCSWSFVGYLPAAVGIFLGQFSQSLLIEFYLARLMSFLCFFLAVVYALKRTPQPYQKWLWFFTLIPMTLHQASAISYDATQLTMIPLMYMYVTHFLEESTRIPRKRTIILFLLTLLVFVLAKPTSLSFFLLIFLIPKQKKIFQMMLFCLAIGLTLPFLRPLHYPDLGSGVNPTLQLAVVLHEPVYALRVFLHTIGIDTGDIITGLIGNFGWLDYQLQVGIYYLYLIAFGYLLARREKAVKPVPRSTLLLLISCVALTYILTYLALYLSWSNVGANIITGVQGRYFLILIPWVGCIATLLHKYVRLIAILGAIVLVMAVTHAIYLRYWDYSHYGANDLEKAEGNKAMALTPTQYQVKIPTENGKGVGFYFHLNAEPIKNSVYHYAIKSRDCGRTERIGYFLVPNPDHQLDYTVTTDPFPVQGGGFCVELTQLVQDEEHVVSVVPYEGGVLIQARYLIPSLH